MVALRKINPMVRAIGVVGAVAALVTSITFAALSSSATLTDNSISSAVANLEVKSAGQDFSDSDTGFAFTKVVPGGDPAPDPGFNFQLRNSGGSQGVPIEVFVWTDALPTWEPEVNNDKVSLNLACTGGGLTPLAEPITLNELLTGVSLGTLAPTEGLNVADCVIQASMDADAVDGEGASTTTNFDLIFGTQVVDEPVTPPTEG